LGDLLQEQMLAGGAEAAMEAVKKVKCILAMESELEALQQRR
jgi:hypothetical protein